MLLLTTNNKALFIIIILLRARGLLSSLFSGSKQDQALPRDPGASSPRGGRSFGPAPRGRWCTASLGPRPGAVMGHTVSVLSETVCPRSHTEVGTRGEAESTRPDTSLLELCPYFSSQPSDGLKNCQVNIFPLKICRKNTNLGEKIGRSEHSYSQPTVRTGGLGQEANGAGRTMGHGWGK